MQLVPPERRSEKFPCRHIPLDASGQTLDSLYRQCHQQEVEGTVGKWLRATIERLEEERKAQLQQENKHLIPSGEVRTGCLSFRSSIQNVPIQRVRLLFTGWKAGSFSDFGPTTDSRLAPTALSIIGSANIAPMS